MTPPTPPPARPLHLVLLRDLPVALAVTALMLATAYVLWDHFGTLEPDSADIGGGPIGALVGGSIGAVLALLDVSRRGPRAALPRWVLVAASTLVVLLVTLGVRRGLDPFLPVAVTLITVLMMMPVGVVLSLGSVVHDARVRRGQA